MAKLTTKEAMCQIANELHNDESYRQGWKANITMSFYDKALDYRNKTGRKYLSNVDIHRIANDAADAFISHLITNNNCNGTE